MCKRPQSGLALRDRSFKIVINRWSFSTKLTGFEKFAARCLPAQLLEVLVLYYQSMLGSDFDRLRKYVLIRKE